MHTPITPDDRIAELEDALKEKERRLQELKADLDKANDLIERHREHVQDSSDLIDSWIEAFDMHLNAEGVWEWRASFAEGHE